MYPAVPGYEHIIAVNQGKSQWKPHTPIPKLSLDDSHYAALRTSIEEDAANAMPDCRQSSLYLIQNSLICHVP
jgi:hypothetical protein